MLVKFNLILNRKRYYNLTSTKINDGCIVILYKCKKKSHSYKSNKICFSVSTERNILICLTKLIKIETCLSIWNWIVSNFVLRWNAQILLNATEQVLKRNNNAPYFYTGPRRRTCVGGTAGQTKSRDSDTRASRHAEEGRDIPGLRAWPVGRTRAQTQTPSAWFLVQKRQVPCVYLRIRYNCFFFFCMTEIRYSVLAITYAAKETSVKRCI